MAFSSRRPRVSVVAYTAEGYVDLTPYVLRVQTQKSLANIEGKWSITLTAKRDRQGRTWDKRIAAFDYIEIRIGTSSNPSPIMRGFVENSVMIEGFDAEGRPQRSVMANGYDYGGLLTKDKIYYLYEMDPTQGLTRYQLEVNFGIPAADLTPNLFVQLVHQNIIAPFIAQLQTGNPHIPDLLVETSVPDTYRINGFLVQPFQGVVSQLLQAYQGKPWCELFVVDRDGGPVLVYRWAPLKNKTGTIMRGGAGTVEITSSDRISSSLGRSGQELLNYWFTIPNSVLLNKIGYKAASTGLMAVGRNPAIDREKLKYGFRPLEVESPLIPLWSVGATEEEIERGKDIVQATAAELNDWLRRAYDHNETLLAGSMTIKGNERAQIGSYVVQSDRGFSAYIESVTHEWQLYGQWTTTLGLTRGRES